MTQKSLQALLALGFLYMTGVPEYWIYGRIVTAQLIRTTPVPRFPGDPSPAFLAHYEYPGGQELPTISAMPAPRSIEAWVVPGSSRWCEYTRWSWLVDLLIVNACLTVGFAIVWIGELVKCLGRMLRSWTGGLLRRSE